MQTAIPCTVMRGGTSKGLYFLASDLPADAKTRDAVLLAAMGSPDIRQIDGMGGAHPLTSKIAVIGPTAVEALFGGYSSVIAQAVGILAGVQAAAP